MSRRSKKCELIRCLSDHDFATVDCNDYDGQSTFLVCICSLCAKALNILPGGTLPPPAECSQLLAQARRQQRAEKECPT